MTIVHWLAQLIDDGRLTVPPPVLADATADSTADAAETAALHRLLFEWDQRARLDAPGDAPDFSPKAAQWAAHLLYRACQFFVYREIDGDIVREALAERFPTSPSAEACWSVDLVFRYLPDLLSLARGLATGDPLVEGLESVARDWPLSSVGVKRIGEIDIAPFIDDPCLRCLYAERIIDRSDGARLADPRAAEAVREAIGAFPNLAPAIPHQAARVT